MRTFTCQESDTGPLQPRSRASAAAPAEHVVEMDEAPPSGSGTDGEVTATLLLTRCSCSVDAGPTMRVAKHPIAATIATTAREEDNSKHCPLLTLNGAILDEFN